MKIYKGKLVKNLRPLHRGEKEQRRKGRIYLEKEYICSAEEKKNGEGEFLTQNSPKKKKKNLNKKR